jgi:hypothetical protein
MSNIKDAECDASTEPHIGTSESGNYLHNAVSIGVSMVPLEGDGWACCHFRTISGAPLSQTPVMHVIQSQM